MLGTIEQQQQSSMDLLTDVVARSAGVFEPSTPPDEELFHQLAFE
jgi:hypothetical protein